MSDALKAGDRVRLVPHASWNQPLRKYAEEERLATVRNSFVPQGAERAIVAIVFDMKRKMKVPQQPYFLSPDEMVRVNVEKVDV